MATPKSQRIGIWIIAIVLAIGTLASFLVLALNINNSQSNVSTPDKLPLTGYRARTFDASSVTSLKVEVLKQGDGAIIKSTDSVNVSYFGWTSNGKIFGSSQESASIDNPIPLSLTGVIAGWTEGLTGQKVGSVVRLTIPADKAYGVQSPDPSVPPNSPLEFIVEIHKIDTGTQT